MQALMICQLKRTKEILNKHFMKKDFVETENEPVDEPIVIADECGDSMWDDVLNQEVKACKVKVVSKSASSLLNSIDAVKVSDTTKA